MHEDLESKESDGKEKKIHQPEFVILEGTEEEGHPGSAQLRMHQEYIELLQKLNKRSYSWGVRVITFITALFLGIATLLLAILLVVFVAIAALALFRNHDVNVYMFKAWRNFRKMLVMTTGMFIATFSPSLGLGFILLYFMLLGESFNQTFVSKVFRSKEN